MTTNDTNTGTCESCGKDAELYWNEERGIAVCAPCDVPEVDDVKPVKKAPAKAKTPVELSTREVADKIGTDPKTLRVFLRASKDYNAVGSGARYSFTAKDIPTMKTRFNKWTKEREASRKAKAEAKVAANKAAAPVADDATPA